MVSLILLVAAFLLALFATCIMQGYGRWHFGWASLACYFLHLLLAAQHV